MRREGWEQGLHAMIEGARQRPFAWGSHDCATWVAEVRRVLTGVDAAKDWRGSYRTASGAMRAIRKAGAGDMASAVTARLGAPLPVVALAQRGDVVCRDRALGICTGQDVAFLGPDGLVFQPLTACDMAWSV